MTALHIASYSGHDEVVRVLLAAKATVNTQTEVGFVVQTHFPLFTLFSSYVQWGETPLYFASLCGHQKCMEVLIDAGGRVNVPTEVSVSSSLWSDIKRFSY